VLLYICIHITYVYVLVYVHMAIHTDVHVNVSTYLFHVVSKDMIIVKKQLMILYNKDF
jgi:hypothetical protein